MSRYHHANQMVLSMVVLGFCGFLFYYFNNKSDDYYIVLTVNNTVKNCYMKMPLVDKKYEGTSEMVQTRDGRENTAFCDVDLPKDLNKRHRVCVLTGVSVDGLDVDNKNSIHRWSCDVGKTSNHVSISMNVNATRAEVLCSMTCI